MELKAPKYEEGFLKRLKFKAHLNFFPILRVLVSKNFCSLMLQILKASIEAF